MVKDKSKKKDDDDSSKAKEALDEHEEKIEQTKKDLEKIAKQNLKRFTKK